MGLKLTAILGRGFTSEDLSVLFASQQLATQSVGGGLTYPTLGFVSRCTQCRTGTTSLHVALYKLGITPVLQMTTLFESADEELVSWNSTTLGCIS